MKGSIESINVMKTTLSEPSEFSGLNNDEIRRITAVIERDFKLRQREYKRIEELKNIIRQEHECIERLTGSKEFSTERCIRCSKSFRIFFNPKEICLQCKLNVCHDCAIFHNPTKTWACKLCLKLKELESLTADWFYLQTRKKYKRCGSAKVVRELYKRDQKRSEIDDDPGYATLQKSLSSDSASVISYIVNDRTLQNELNEYSKRLIFLIDDLKSDISNRNENREDFNDYQQLITSEISRTRMALSVPIRCSNKKLNQSYENDLQNLIIQKTEEILQINLQQFSKNEITSNFDQQLAQIIFDNYVKKEIPTKPQRQSEIKSRSDSLRKMNLSRTPTLNEEEDEEDKNENITPTSSSIEDPTHRFIDTDPDTIRKSAERVDDWKANFTLMESEIIPSDNDEQEEHSTWL